MSQVKLSIEGMSCGHCVSHVRKTLEELPGVTAESVEIGEALVAFDESVIQPGRIEEALSAEGYPARAAWEG